MENYRPISLWNDLYKTLAIVLGKRISEQVDPYIHRMQYGFRRKRVGRYCSNIPNAIVT